MASKGGGPNQIVGYKYFMAVHFGIGRGPIDELTEIKVGDLHAWSGSLTYSQFFNISQPSLFGGNEKEGGIEGTAKIYMGEPTQTIDSIITGSMEGGFPVPGWRGVTTVFYYGLIGSNNPYPKAWKFRVNRRLQGWDTEVWEPTLASIDVSSTPLTLLSFNSNPNFGDSIIVGGFNVGFYTLEGPLASQIGSDTTQTASNFASMCNSQSDDLFGVTATAVDNTVTLQFPTPIVVGYGTGGGISIASTGGGIKAMNPAHILYECATNNVWGRGLPVGLIDTTSFRNAALQLAAEGFGLCIRWNRQEDIDKFVKIVVDHIGAAVYIHRQTGLLTLKLIRDDYDSNLLDEFTFENGILDIIEDESSSIDTTFNEIIVQFVDPISGNRGSLRAQNLASFQSLETLISTTVQYDGLPTAALAARVAQRDLQINSSDVRRMKIKMDRVGWFISPGDVFKISVPSRGIENMILRAGRIEDGPIDDETITITAVQDVFGLPDTSFVVPQPGYWTPPNRGARVISERLLDEMTYYDLSENMPSAELAMLTDDTGVIKIFAEQPTGFSADYIIYDKTTTETEFVNRGVAGFDAGAELSSAIGLHDGTAFAESFTEINLLTSVGIPILIVGSAYQEYCRLDDIDLETGELTISRGCIDTIPHKFVAGDKVWFQTHMPSTDGRDYAASEEVLVKLLTRTTSDVLDPGFAPTDTIDIGGRQGRPYPPGNFLIASVPFEEVQNIVGDIVFSWTHRDRLTQGNFLLEHEAGSTGPEGGTTYNIRVYDGSTDPETATPLREVTGLTGTTWTYTVAMSITDGDLHSYWFVLESERNSLVSWQHYIIKVSRISSGFDDGFDDDFNGGATGTKLLEDHITIKIMEDGETKVTE